MFNRPVEDTPRGPVIIQSPRRGVKHAVATLLRRIESTEIEVNAQAREFVAARGGTLFLRVRHNRCCSGGLTYLDAATSARHEFDDYECLNETNPEVRLFHTNSVLPSKVSVELRGKLRPHLVAYWDGCAFRL